MCSNNPSDGYLTPQLNEGVPVAAPMQPGSDGTAPRGYQQPVVIVPVSGASPGQHVIVQAASSEGMATSTPQEQFQSHLVRISPSNAMSSTDSSPQESEIPRSFRHGGYALLKNEEVGAAFCVVGRGIPIERFPIMFSFGNKDQRYKTEGPNPSRGSNQP